MKPEPTQDREQPSGTSEDGPPSLKHMCLRPRLTLLGQVTIKSQIEYLRSRRHGCRLSRLFLINRIVIADVDAGRLRRGSRLKDLPSGLSGPGQELPDAARQMSRRHQALPRRLCGVRRSIGLWVGRLPSIPGMPTQYELADGRRLPVIDCRQCVVAILIPVGFDRFCLTLVFKTLVACKTVPRDTQR
jgi:hypothetical protein